MWLHDKYGVSSDAIFVVCSHTFHSLPIEKDGRVRQNISFKFPCACPTMISSIFGKSFHFPFPYFCVIHISVLSFPHGLFPVFSTYKASHRVWGYIIGWWKCRCHDRWLTKKLWQFTYKSQHPSFDYVGKYMYFKTFTQYWSYNLPQSWISILLFWTIWSINL